MRVLTVSVISNLEPCRTPVHKLDGFLGLDISDGGVDVLGHHVSPVEEADRHVLPVLGVTLDHLILRLKTRLGDHIHPQALVISLLSGN